MSTKKFLLSALNVYKNSRYLPSMSTKLLLSVLNVYKNSCYLSSMSTKTPVICPQFIQKLMLSALNVYENSCVLFATSAYTNPCYLPSKNKNPWRGFLHNMLLRLVYHSCFNFNLVPEVFTVYRKSILRMENIAYDVHICCVHLNNSAVNTINLFKAMSVFPRRSAPPDTVQPGLSLLL